MELLMWAMGQAKAKKPQSNQSCGIKNEQDI